MISIIRIVLFFSCLLAAQVSFADLRDPTRPENASEYSNANLVQSWELQAIIISPERKLAIFNGHTLMIGQQVGGFKVVEIHANTVHLEGPDGKMTLFLFNQNIKRIRGDTNSSFEKERLGGIT